MRDIGIKCDDGKFKLRTSAIIIRDNKILLEKSKCGSGYIFPGGHIEFGEITSEAIIREVKEEINLDVKIIDLYCVVELIYKDNDGKINQEINYYYKLECIDSIDFEDFKTKENDKGEEKCHEFHWFNIDEIDTAYLKSKKIVGMIKENINRKNEIVLIDER